MRLGVRFVMCILIPVTMLVLFVCCPSWFLQRNISAITLVFVSIVGCQVDKLILVDFSFSSSNAKPFSVINVSDPSKFF